VAGEPGSVEVIGCSACLEELATIKSRRSSRGGSRRRSGRTTCPAGRITIFPLQFSVGDPITDLCGWNRSAVEFVSNHGGDRDFDLVGRTLDMAVLVMMGLRNGERDRDRCESECNCSKLHCCCNPTSGR
jgi:hypothetical protein